MNRITIDSELWHKINVGGEIAEINDYFKFENGCKQIFNADFDFPFTLTHRESNHQLQFFYCRFQNVVIIEQTTEWQGAERFVDSLNALCQGLKLPEKIHR